MADSGIKRVVIPKEQLPALGGNNLGYVVRYRIVSEDRNRVSHWSPRHTLTSQPISEIPHAIATTVSASDPSKVLVNATWTAPTDVDIRNFDVYVKINNNPWSFVGTTSTNTYSVIATTGTTVTIAVQVQTYPKNRYNDATLFESEGISL